MRQQALYSFFSAFALPTHSTFPRGVIPARRNVPTLLVYRGGETAHTYVGLAAFGGPGRASADSVEWVLGSAGFIETSLDANPLAEKRGGGGGFSLLGRGGGRRRDDDEDDD